MLQVRWWKKTSWCFTNDDILFWWRFWQGHIFCDKMGILSLDFERVNLGCVNFNEDDSEIIVHARLRLGAINLNTPNYVKKI